MGSCAEASEQKGCRHKHSGSCNNDRRPQKSKASTPMIEASLRPRFQSHRFFVRKNNVFLIKNKCVVFAAHIGPCQAMRIRGIPRFQKSTAVKGPVNWKHTNPSNPKGSNSSRLMWQASHAPPRGTIIAAQSILGEFERGQEYLKAGSRYSHPVCNPT